MGKLKQLSRVKPVDGAVGAVGNLSKWSKFPARPNTPLVVGLYAPDCANEIRLQHFVSIQSIKIVIIYEIIERKAGIEASE